ncbi:MAG: cell division transporter substrate-binding protein FtsY [Firmicutes bacterium]|nr:cell division transporter substrate-binding protein FtsY [Bacillota bacterium]
MGFFDRLKDGLSKTRKGFTEKIEQLITGYATIDEEFLEELEAVLLMADVGVHTTMQLIEDIRGAIKAKKINSPEELRPFLAVRIGKILNEGMVPLARATEGPTVIVVVGVNGVGKTTTIGKLGHYYHDQGNKVLLAAGDTFRAAAIDQLEIWGQRIDVDVICQSEGSDPAAVAYDAVQAAKARKADILIIDTAGRIHTKSNLMEELKKIHRVISREIPEAPHEVLLVLDATTGQNAISQAKLFKEAVNVTGVVLTKLDGTAKGGVVVAIKADLGLPVKWIGVGEGADDLRPFDPAEFAEALFSKN